VQRLAEGAVMHAAVHFDLAAGAAIDEPAGQARSIAKLPSDSNSGRKAASRISNCSNAALRSSPVHAYTRSEPGCLSEHDFSASDIEALVTPTSDEFVD
jgi:hypothetical protein